MRGHRLLLICSQVEPQPIIPKPPCQTFSGPYHFHVMYSSTKASHGFVAVLGMILGFSAAATLRTNNETVDKRSQVSLAAPSRSIFWERCELQQGSRGVEERCCRGNYRCSEPVCHGKGLCTFGMFHGLMWCFNKSCEPVRRSDNDSNSGNRGNVWNDKKGSEFEPISTLDPESGGGTSSVPPPQHTYPPVVATPLLTPTSVPTHSMTPSPTSAKIPANVRCRGMRKRRDVRDLSTAELRDWQSSVLELVESGEWDALNQAHSENRDAGHGGGYFLPWHRLFILRMENAVRKRRPNFALPYWDWRADAIDPAMSSVWRPDIAGGAERPNGPIIGGAFDRLRAAYPTPHFVRRNVSSGVRGDIPPFWDSASLERLAIAEWPAFADGIEAAHALVHVYVSGDMGSTVTAPNDPLFYLHHGLVDLLLEDRIRKTGAHDFSGTHDFAHGSENVSTDYMLSPFDVTVSYALQLSCVEYIPFSHRQNAASAARGKRAPSSVCASLRDGEGLSTTRCRRGENALRQGHD